MIHGMLLDIVYNSLILFFVYFVTSMYSLTTHNNECKECDYRITHVPARDWPKGWLRPIHDNWNMYPRYLEDPGSHLDIHGSDYYPSWVDFSVYNWTFTMPIGFIDQVEHTYAYTLGTYGIQNEKQLSIGESTCRARFTAKPVLVDGGRALITVYMMTEIAMERCATARCAIQLMGDLATRYGYYGPGWEKDVPSAQDEAGEALVVSDTRENW
jgi:hypothetical protein